MSVQTASLPNEMWIAFLGRPDVSTDAIRTFFSSGMHALAIGDLVMEKQHTS